MENKKLRCHEEDFFKLMKTLQESDSAHTTREQISTENTVKAAYTKFLAGHDEDPE